LQKLNEAMHVKYLTHCQALKNHSMS
jgi:hypothetical protein